MRHDNKLIASVAYYDVIRNIFGTDGMILPKDLTIMCLEYANLCGRGRSSVFFWVYF
jgi:hypothetical protein